MFFFQPSKLCICVMVQTFAFQWGRVCVDSEVFCPWWFEPSDLDVIFSSLTKDSCDSGVSVDLVTKKKTNSWFVKNSGIVLYDSSSLSSDSDDKVDIIHDSPQILLCSSVFLAKTSQQTVTQLHDSRLQLPRKNCMHWLVRVLYDLLTEKSTGQWICFIVGEKTESKKALVLAKFLGGTLTKMIWIPKFWLMFFSHS